MYKMKSQNQTSIFNLLRGYMGKKGILMPFSITLSVLGNLVGILPFVCVWLIIRLLFTEGTAASGNEIVRYAGWRYRKETVRPVPLVSRRSSTVWFNNPYPKSSRRCMKGSSAKAVMASAPNVAAMTPCGKRNATSIRATNMSLTSIWRNSSTRSAIAA